MSSKIRDEELKRIVLYAKGLGIKIRIRDFDFQDAALWGPDPAEIDVNLKKHRGNKTALILSILHELAHHIHFRHTKEPIPDEVLEDQLSLSKKKRKKIYEYEAKGIAYMSLIATELDLKISAKKIEKAMEFDTFQYAHYYETGKWLTSKEKRQKHRELKEKYK